MTKQTIHGLHEILGAQADSAYDVVLVDQWGVLHNGTAPYVGAVDAFAQLLSTHPNNVIVLSNTSRRAYGIAKLLETLGFPKNVRGIVTGGEAAFAYLQEHRETMTKCALMTSDEHKTMNDRRKDPESLFCGLNNLELVSMEEAEFLIIEGSRQICYGPNPEDVTPIPFYETGEEDDTIRAFVERGLERKLPLVCTNPDLIAIVANNQTVYMGGQIARQYEARGGSVQYFGKPNKVLFEACLRMAGYLDKPERVIHIGDSMHHDIQGAVNTGIDSVLIAGGVHSDELDVQVETVSVGQAQEKAATTTHATLVVAKQHETKTIDSARVQTLCDKMGIEPTYVLRSFCW